MKAIASRIAAALIVVVLPVSAAGAAGSGPVLALDGTLVNHAQLLRGASTATFRVRLERMSSPAESDAFVELFRDRGAFALQTALHDAPIGRLEIGNRLGWPIGFTQTVTDESGTHLLLVAMRPMTTRDLFFATRSGDYLFAALLVDFDADGVSRAELLPSAKLRVLEDGRIDLVSRIERPMPILGLRKRAS